MNIGIHTLGCKLNFSESSTFVRELIDGGCKIVDFETEADVYIIHSCAVTQTAEKKTRSVIRQAYKRNPKARIYVIGCYAQLKPDDIAEIEGVTAVLGNEDKFDIVRMILEQQEGDELFQSPCCKSMSPDNFHSAWSGGDRTRSFVKIQDGCDYYCSYCTVPYARGASRSGTISQTMESIRSVVENGFKEIIITGVNLGDFGRKNGETFYDLLLEIEKEERVKRVRISSIEPNLLTDEIIDLVGRSDKLLPHFHIPLQSGSDVMLKLMKRRYETSLFARKVRYIKQIMPHACIAADVIVGFNGETDEEFQNAYNFIESLPISYLHVFTYSERPGTRGVSMDGRVPNGVRDRRSKLLHELSDSKLEAFHKENKGREAMVLWEDNNKDGMMTGWTENYIEVKRLYDKDLVNTIQRVVI